MFCPRCGSGQAEEMKFCKACGANLFAVRGALDNRATSQMSNWDKARAAEMSMSAGEVGRRQDDVERRRGITAAIRRFREIKAGVIVASAGLGTAIFLAVFMQAIIRSGEATGSDAEILSHLWVVGVIPLLVGIALIVNGYLVSKKIVELFQETEKPLEYHQRRRPWTDHVSHQRWKCAQNCRNRGPTLLCKYGFNQNNSPNT